MMKAEKNFSFCSMVWPGWALDRATTFDVIFDQARYTTGQVVTEKLKHLWPNKTKDGNAW